jgi:hypothetical protein
MTIIQKISPKKYSYEDWIIDYCDKIIELSLFKKELDLSFFIQLGQSEHKEKSLANIANKRNSFYQGNTPKDGFEFDKKIEHDIYYLLLTNQYFIHNENKYLITDKGVICYELGGHKKYIKHRRRELSVLKNQNTINLILGLTAIASVCMPIIIEIYKSDKPNEIKFSNKTDSLLNRQTVIIDSLQKDIRSIKDNHIFLQTHKIQPQEKK